jgi:hypothetical protein
MTILLILLGITALAILAPRFGVDSRGLDSGRDAPWLEDKLWSRQP